MNGTWEDRIASKPSTLTAELFSADFDTITAVDENSPEHRIAQVHKFVDSFNSGRVDGIMMVVHELFHEDVVLRDPNLGTYTGDWNAIRDYWDGLMKSFDNHFVKVSNVRMTDADTVSLDWIISGRQIAPCFGVPATFKAISIRGSGRYSFRGGKMCEVEWTWSGISLLQQLLGIAGGVVSDFASGLWSMVKNAGRRLSSSESAASQDTIDISHGATSPTLSARSQGVAGCNNASSIKQETVLTEGRLDVAEGVNSVLHTENSLPPTQAIMQVATDAQISNARNSFVVPYAEGRAARRYKDQDDKQGEGPSDLELTIASVRASEPWYACGYCGTRKASTSAGGDGRVRIRCECGGKHKDRKARMHANWRPCSPDAHRAVYLHSC